MAYQNSPLTVPEILCQPSPGAAPPLANGSSSTAGGRVEPETGQTAMTPPVALARGWTRRG